MVHTVGIRVVKKNMDSEQYQISHFRNFFFFSEWYSNWNFFPIKITMICQVSISASPASAVIYAFTNR